MKLICTRANWRVMKFLLTYFHTKFDFIVAMKKLKNRDKWNFLMVEVAIIQLYMWVATMGAYERGISHYRLEDLE